MTENSLSVSIVIPLYNGKTTIKKTLESLLTQKETFQELIIVDDNSNDTSYDIVKNFLNKESVIYRIIKNKSSRGLAGSYNVGILESRSELVVTMHQDVVLVGNALELLIEPFFNNKNIVASSHVVDHPYNIWLTYNFWQKCLFSRLVNKKFYGIDGKFDCFNKKVLKNIGLFDNKNFRSAGEDGDIINKLKKMGVIAKTDAEIIHLHSLDPNFGIRHLIHKQSQYSEAQGALFRLYGVNDAIEFLRIFFREILIVALFIPYVRIVSAVAIIAYSFWYTKDVYVREWKNVRILILPVVNMGLLLVGSIYSLKGFIYGKQKI